MSSKFNQHYKEYKGIYLIILAFLLIGLIGALLIHYSQETNKISIKYGQDLQYTRQEGKETMEKMDQLISKRHLDALNYIYAIESLNENQITPEEFAAVRAKYLAAKDNWNYEWSSIRANLKSYFSDEAEQIFYNHEGDSKAEEEKATNNMYWEKMSITGKFRALHEAIAKAKGSKAKEDIEMATKIYDSLSYDLHAFYDKLGLMLSSGQLGPMIRK